MTYPISTPFSPAGEVEAYDFKTAPVRSRVIGTDFHFKKFQLEYRKEN